MCCLSPMIAWIFAGIPAFLVLISILVNNLLVYCHVRSTLQRSRIYMKDYQPSGMGDTARESSIARASRRVTALIRGSSPEDPQLQRIQAVATQAFLYVAVFVVLQTPTFILRVMEAQNSVQDEAQVFPLLMLQAIMWPIQGLFTCLIYIRPSYLKSRTEYPNESRWWAFRRSLGAKVQPTDEPASEETQTQTKTQPR